MSQSKQMVCVFVCVCFGFFHIAFGFLAELTCLFIVSSTDIGQHIPVDQVSVARRGLDKAVSSQRGSECHLWCF